MIAPITRGPATSRPAAHDPRATGRDFADVMRGATATAAGHPAAGERCGRRDAAPTPPRDTRGDDPEPRRDDAVEGDAAHALAAGTTVAPVGPVTLGAATPVADAPSARRRTDAAASRTAAVQVDPAVVSADGADADPVPGADAAGPAVVGSDTTPGSSGGTGVGGAPTSGEDTADDASASPAVAPLQVDGPPADDAGTDVTAESAAAQPRHLAGSGAGSDAPVEDGLAAATTPTVGSGAPTATGGHAPAADPVPTADPAPTSDPSSRAVDLLTSDGGAAGDVAADGSRQSAPPAGAPDHHAGAADAHPQTATSGPASGDATAHHRSAAAPARGGAAVDRVMQVAEALRTGPAPRSVTVDLESLGGTRVVVRVTGDVVSVTPAAGSSMTDGAFGDDLARGLAERGMQLADPGGGRARDQHRRHGERSPAAPSTAPDDVRADRDLSVPRRTGLRL